MSIEIADQRATTLLEEIQAATHRNKDRILLELLQREEARLHRLRDLEQRRQRIESLATRYSARLKTKPESADDILGYNRDGLPE